MNRHTFLDICLAGGAFLFAPFSALAKNSGKKRTGKGFEILSGKDRFDKPLSLFEGDTFYTKVATKDTDGDLYVYEATRVKNGGPALHFHYEQDEFWYVMQGTFLIKVGDDIYHAKQGDCVFGPRKVPHAFARWAKEKHDC